MNPGIYLEIYPKFISQINFGKCNLLICASVSLQST